MSHEHTPSSHWVPNGTTESGTLPKTNTNIYTSDLFYFLLFFLDAARTHERNEIHTNRHLFEAVYWYVSIAIKIAIDKGTCAKFLSTDVFPTIYPSSFLMMMDKLLGKHDKIIDQQCVLDVLIQIHKE